MRASHRARSASEAIVERVIASYLRPGVANLAPGVAYWSPPTLTMLQAGALRGSSGYGDCQGEPAPLDALRCKLECEDGESMSQRDVMVTHGANQAFVQALLCLCDVGDECVLFRPYYFSHLVAMQLLGVRPVIADCDPRTGQPDVDSVRGALRRPGSRVRAVVLVSPSNPSGTVVQPEVTQQLRAECEKSGAWLVADLAYEHFSFGAVGHSGDHSSALGGSVLPAQTDDRGPVAADNLVTLRTFSKSYGLAAWRVGYTSYPSWLHEDMLKVQDTMPTHACRASQRVALAAQTHLGTAWVRDRVSSLEPARAALWSALAPLRQSEAQPVQQPAGAFYYWLRLPSHMVEEEEAVIRWLAEEHALLLLPGSAFGAPGYLRLSYGGLGVAGEIAAVAERLSRAAEMLARGSGPAAR